MILLEFKFSIAHFSAFQVWDHISGKLKKDLQYQADVSCTLSLSICVCFDFVYGGKCIMGMNANSLA